MAELLEERLNKLVRSFELCLVADSNRQEETGRKKYRSTLRASGAV